MSNHGLAHFTLLQIPYLRCPQIPQIHLLKLGPASSFLTRVLDPPPPRSVTAALTTLREARAASGIPPTVVLICAAVIALPMITT